jgi:hypothetical protein
MIKLLKELDRRDLILAVWSAEFVRALGGSAQTLAEAPQVQYHMAERAAESANQAVEALRLLLLDVK